MNQTEEYPRAKLILSDGTEFKGYSFGARQSTSGEVVFNTGMTGYPQSLTDPSYAGQILTFTFPLIGNYGVAKKNRDEHGILKWFESEKIHLKGIIVNEFSKQPSHWKSSINFEKWLQDEQVPAIFDIDTRELTKRLRSKGVMLGKIVIANKDVALEDPNKVSLVKSVSTNAPYTCGKGSLTIIVVDCGVKLNIIRKLLKHDVNIKVVPWDYDFTKEHYDGLFLSNGPGDPQMCKKTINHVKAAMKNNKPIFGICLGHQLLALAAGGKTYKLKFGHRSQNQPVLNSQEKGFITSQNHGFAVDFKTLPREWIESFTNGNDNTNEGIKHKTKPFFSVQFHPEGRCGPRDTDFLFDEFISLIKVNNKTKRNK